MPHLTLMAINDAIADAFRGQTVTYADGEARRVTVQSYDELTEAINDLPTVQVFWQRSRVDATTATDRTTFGAGVMQGEYEFIVRVFARQRSNLADDMAACMVAADFVEGVLESVGEDCVPFFGLDGIAALRWDGQRVVFDYATVIYVGAEYTLYVRVA